MKASFENDFDILIVGMGVSGSLLAYNLIRSGFKVACIERGGEKDIRTIWTNEIPVEVFNSPLLNNINIPEVFTPEISAVKGQDENIAFYIDTRKYVKSIDMKRFVQNLRDEVASAGASLFYNTEVDSINNDGNGIIARLKSKDSLFDLRTSYVIDCSGIGSFLRENYFKNEIFEADYILAYRYSYKVKAEKVERFWENHKLAYGSSLLKLSENGGFNTIAFYPDIKNESVEILIGGSDKELKSRIKEVLKKEFGVSDKSVYGGGGIIPIRRPFINLYKNRVFRIGDAASMTYPMCASGVATIIWAAEYLIEALKSDNPSLYQKKFNLFIAGKYTMMTFFRRIIEEADREEAKLLFDMVINPLSMKYTLGNRSVLRPELILKTMRHSFKLFKDVSLIRKTGIYLLAGGIDFVLYSLSAVYGDVEQLPIIESRMVKLFTR